jgi:hypothetical protein
MVNKFFAWKYSGVAIAVFYGLGAVCWRLGVHSHHYQRWLLVAAVFLMAGLVCSLGWVWRSPLFRTIKVIYNRRYSDQQLYRHSDIVSHAYAMTQPERRTFGIKPRKGKKKIRQGLTACFVGLFLICFLWLGLSMKAPRPVNNRGRLEIYLSDGIETLTRPAPAMPRSVNSRTLVFALANVPVKEMEIHHKDTTATIQVVLRNLSPFDIKNAHVEISSNAPIKPADGAGVVLSSNEMSANTGAMTPYARTKQEQAIKLDLSIPQPRTTVGLYVTVSGENVQPSAGVENINFSEIPDSGAAGLLPKPKLSRAATPPR